MGIINFNRMTSGKTDTINTLGFGQLNAFIFFFTRFTTFQPIYQWIDLWTSVMFLIRTIFYFRMWHDASTIKKRSDYFLSVKITLVGLVISAFLTIILNWIEWGGTFAAFPGYPLLSWVLWGVVQVFTWRLIKSYVEEVHDKKGEQVENQDMSNMNVDGANQIQ